MTPEPKLIQPRTKSERKAYVQGYIDALTHAQKDGMLSAVTWAKEMTEFEGMIDDKED